MVLEQENVTSNFEVIDGKIITKSKEIPVSQIQKRIDMVAEKIAEMANQITDLQSDKTELESRKTQLQNLINQI